MKNFLSSSMICWPRERYLICLPVTTLKISYLGFAMRSEVLAFKTPEKTAGLSSLIEFEGNSRWTNFVYNGPRIVRVIIECHLCHQLRLTWLVNRKTIRKYEIFLCRLSCAFPLWVAPCECVGGSSQQSSTAPALTGSMPGQRRLWSLSAADSSLRWSSFR